MKNQTYKRKKRQGFFCPLEERRPFLIKEETGALPLRLKNNLHYKRKDRGLTP
jgi:hypothetical protein